MSKNYSRPGSDWEACEGPAKNRVQTSQPGHKHPPVRPSVEVPAPEVPNRERSILMDTVCCQSATYSHPRGPPTNNGQPRKQALLGTPNLVVGLGKGRAAGTTSAKW